MFVKTNIKKVNDKVYKTHLVVQGKKIKGKTVHETILNISKLPEETIESIRKSLKHEKLYTKDEFKILESKDYGTIDILLKLSKQLKLNKILGANYKEVLAMVFNRILHPGSKRSLLSWANTTSMLELLSLNDDDLYHEKLYLIMDQLEKDKKTIEEKLFAARKTKPEMILYDITSTYFEGNSCELAEYGYSRDHRPDKKQIVIGLVTDESGEPISENTFEGNTSDRSTLKDQVNELKTRFGISDVTFVFDKGMVSQDSLDFITGNEMSNCDYITSITRPEILKIINNSDSIQLSLFDTTDIQECVIDNVRYIVCNNPLRADSDKAKREKQIKKTTNDLEKLKKYVQKGKGQPENYIIEKITEIFNKYYTKKYFTVKTSDKVLEYSLNQEAIDKELVLDGKYAIKTTLLDSKITKENIRKSYKNLSKVENAFKDIKTYLEIRPIYHHNDPRVKAHVFICFLAYYLMWHLEQKLEPLLKDYAFYELINELKELKSNTVSLCSETFLQLTEKTALQRKIYATIK
jgi:transposase